MSSEVEVEDYRSNLQAMTNKYLAVKGRSDLSIEREWILIEFPRSDYMIATVNVPVSGKLQAPLTAYDGPGSFAEQLECFARNLADAIPNIDAARTYLHKYVADVRRAAKEAVAEVKQSGRKLVLKDVGLRTTRASILRGDNWEYAVDHLLAVVHVSDPDAAVEDRDHHLDVEEAEDVADEIGSCLARRY